MRAIILCIILSCVVFAQSEKKRNCGILQNLEYVSQSNPEIYDIIADTEKMIQRQEEYRQSIFTVQQIRVIPVVVHVLYNTSAQNISDEQIISQIRILNEDFRRKEGTKGHSTHPVSADSKIEFRLAEVDPQGNPTNGITRTQTNTKMFDGDDSMKFSRSGGKDAWDTTRYLNIWTCSLGDDLLGYAQFPGEDEKTDGVVILFNAFGDTGNVQAPFNLGRTTTHEVGHWLGLRHIWGDGGCSADDGFKDTPRSDQPNFGAPSHPLIHCGSDDMFENYMDYTDDGAMSIYTQMQSERMNATLDTYRSGLFRWSAFLK